MAVENFVQLAISGFDSHYDHWSMLMENFLRSQEYWKVISEGILDLGQDTTVFETLKAEIDAAKLKDLKRNIIFFKQLIVQS